MVSGTDMDTGKTIRLQRIWKHRRAVIVPFDHGSYSGVVQGLEDPRALVDRIARTKADAVLVTPGILKTIASSLGGLGVMLRIDGGFTAYATVPTDYLSMVTPAQAVAMGADVAIVFTFVGTVTESASIQRLGQTAAEAGAVGLPLVSEVLAPGLLHNHFGSEVLPKPVTGADLSRETMNVCRIAVEAGADIIKTRYTGDVVQFRTVVKNCSVPVLVAGGPRTDGSDDALLQLTHDCIQAGAAGIIFGRNVWQHPKMEKLIDAICAITQDEESVPNAMKLLR
jgi:DhnA family fructose-bisphosphate aldolase class Ia